MATIKQIKDSTGTTHDIVDTKNTAGSTNSSSKLYLIGAASQAANPQTYSNSNCYTSNGRLYSSGITSTDNLVLSNNSEESPKIIFQRKTSTDGYYDYQLSGETGGFKFGYSSTSGQGSVTNIATIDSSGNYSGNAATATMASKLGSSTIGASNRPIYLNAGTPTACYVGEAFLTWGGQDFSGSYGPIDAAMIPNLGANRLAFAKPAGIYIEYSRDGGATWIDYEASDSQKICLTTTTTSAAFTLGKNTVKGDSTSDYMLRITFASGSCNIYTQINKFAIYVSTNGSSLSDASNNMRCTLQIAKNGSENTFTDIKTVNLSGWSGWNIINTSLTMSGSASHTTYANKVRFIFSHDTCNASYLGGSVYRIFGYGGVGWTTPSTLASTGDLYSYDTNQTMIIPTGLYSSSTTGTSNLGLSSKYWKDGYINNLYIGGSAGNTTSKITSDTKTNMYISVNGKIPFVIDASDPSNPKIRASSSLPSTVSLGTSSVPFKDVYADKFNGYTIEKSVPSNAVFTDTVYEHPTSAGNKHIPTGGSSGQYLKYSGTSGTATWASPSDNTATTSAAGFMSSTDKTKLNGIAAGAEVNVQSDWNVTDSTSDAFIKNKPSIPTIPAKNVIYNTHTNGEVAKFDTTTGTITASGYTIAKSVPSNAVFTDTDTKNTAGSTDSSSKLFLIGATSQAANPQTYSHDTAYVGTDGCLYSNSKKVITVSDTVTITTNGIMSSRDKSKLDGIAENANNYTHPTSAGNKHIPSGGSSGQYLKYSSSGTATWASPSDNTATTSAAGFMSSEDKTKLDRVIDYITFVVDLSNYTTDSSLTESINGLLHSDTVPTLKVGDIVKIISSIEFPTNLSSYTQVTVHLEDINLGIINSSGGSRTLGTLKFDFENAYGNAEVCGRWEDRALRKYGGYFYVKITKINTRTISGQPEYLCTILYNNFSGLVSPYSEKTGLLRSVRNIDGIDFNGSSDVRHYGTCTTESGTAAKTATISNFVLNTGSMVVIDFTNNNTTASPTLNISGTGAKSICQLSTSTSVGKFKRGCYMFVYDGTYWQMLNSVETNIYASCTTASTAAAKTATINGFTLLTGATALIRFTNDNTALSPTLNISGTGAEPLFLGSSSTTVDTFNAGLYLIVYDGSHYRMINSVNATKLSFKTSSNNASHIVPFLDKSDYSSGTNSVYVGQSTTYPFSFNPKTGILTVKQTSSSDERLKDFVKDLDINFGDLKRIPKKYFTWKCDEEKHLHIGTSAQELEKIYPELVSEYGDEEEGLYKAVDYSTLSIIALAAIDKLNERIEYLENKLKELE